MLWACMLTELVLLCLQWRKTVSHLHYWPGIKKHKTIATRNIPSRVCPSSSSLCPWKYFLWTKLNKCFSTGVLNALFSLRSDVLIFSFPLPFDEVKIMWPPKGVRVIEKHTHTIWTQVTYTLITTKLHTTRHTQVCKEKAGDCITEWACFTFVFLF